MNRDKVMERVTGLWVRFYKTANGGVPLALVALALGLANPAKAAEGTLAPASAPLPVWHVVADDDFGNPGKQPHLTAGSDFTMRNPTMAEEVLTVAYSGVGITFDYSGLTTNAAYRLDLVFYSDQTRVEKVLINGKVLDEKVALAAGVLLKKSYLIPKDLYDEGLVNVTIAVVEGPNAVVSQATLYSTDSKEIVVEAKEDIWARKLKKMRANLAARRILEYTALFPVFCPMDTNHIVLLDGEWHVSAGGKEGAFKVPGQLLQQGYNIGDEEMATFTREFEVPSGFNGKTIFLRLDAMHGKAKYTVNGQNIGESERLFTPIEFDITKVAKSGKNVLQITSQLKSDSELLSNASAYAHHTLHGIPRSVRVFALPKAHLEDCFVITDLDEHYKNATLKVTLRASEPLALTLQLNGESNIVFKKELSLQNGDNPFEFPIEDPNKWTAETPNLYTLSLVVAGTYKIERQIGFRKIEVRGSKILVNGQMVKLHGVCRHEVDALGGRADTAKWAEKDAELFKKANVNYVRTSHYPPTREFLDACDRVGLYVLCEAPFCWVRGVEKTKDTFVDVVVAPTLAMVSDARNHPSIIGWSLANESDGGPDAKAPWISAFFVTQYHAIKKYDSSRFCIFNNEWAKDDGLCEVAAMHYQAIATAENEPTGRPVLLDEYWHTVAYMPTHQTKDPALRDEWGFKWGPITWPGYVKTQRIQGAAIWAGIDEVFEFADGTEKGYGPWGCIADTRRRIKPEYFHVQMAYSPVWIPQNRLLNLPEGSTTASVTLENHYSFTNLKDLTADWSYLGKHGTVALADIAPWTSGSLVLSVPPSKSGATLMLLFKDKAENKIACWGIQTGKRPAACPTLPSKEAEALKINQELFIKGEGWSVTLDSTSGRLYGRKGNVGMPTELPSPFIIQPEAGFVGSISQYYGDLPDLMTREIKSVAIGKTTDGILTLTVKEAYETMEGTLVWHIGKNGSSTFDYDYEVTENSFSTRVDGKKKKVPLKTISENGLRFILPQTCDTLAWEKQTVWGYAPEWHIGRPVGKTKAHYKGTAAEKDRPWEMLETENGTADFRSTKFNVYEASLTDGSGTGIHYTGDGDVHVRAAMTEAGMELRLFTGTPASNTHIKGRFTVR